MVPISIKKDVFEPNNNNLKFMVRNCSHFCINQIPYLHPIKMHLHIFHNFHWSMSLLCKKLCNLINSVQFSRSVISDSLRPHESSTPGLPVHHQLPELTQTHMSIESVMPSNHLILCHPLSPTLRAYSNSCPLSRWCHPIISSFIILFSSRLQSFPASGSFPISQFFTSGGQSIGSFSFIISPPNEHSGLISFRMDWLDLLAVQGTLKSLLQHHSSKASILQCSAFFIVQLSHPYMITGKTITLTR